MNIRNFFDSQSEICEKYKAVCDRVGEESIAGVAKNVGHGILPINGLRHSGSDNASGWYIWAGDFKEDPDFFEPTHIKHLRDRFPSVLKYLGLPPGWRFQIDNNDYEDVWEDKSLLNM
ncbi:hypothetical protein IT407_02630 [Candidatus Uhrbacteria bacterium]|nr:hypothetical protein [Candidatus Uhrbacteria bacterium]